MGSNVPVAQATSDEAVLPERVQEALGQLVGVAKEGLLALSVEVGLGVLRELLEEEVYKRMLGAPDLALLRAVDRYVGLLNDAYGIRISSERFTMLESNAGDFEWASVDEHVLPHRVRVSAEVSPRAKPLLFRPAARACDRRLNTDGAVL